MYLREDTQTVGVVDRIDSVVTEVDEGEDPPLEAREITGITDLHPRVGKARSANLHHLGT